MYTHRKDTHTTSKEPLLSSFQRFFLFLRHKLKNTKPDTLLREINELNTKQKDIKLSANKTTVFTNFHLRI